MVNKYRKQETTCKLTLEPFQVPVVCIRKKKSKLRKKGISLKCLSDKCIFFPLFFGLRPFQAF